MQTPEVHAYTHLYPVHSIPHTAIIDPRTGERLISFERFIDPKEMVDILSKFIKKNPSLRTTEVVVLDEDIVAKGKQREHETMETLNEGASVEDQLLMAAIAASRELSHVRSPPGR